MLVVFQNMRRPGKKSVPFKIKDLSNVKRKRRKFKRPRRVVF
jgi:hypothetical protein